MTSKQEKARTLLQAAKDAGCTATLKGDWVVFKPPLPIDLLMLAVGLGDELATEVRENG